jgi:hypothetical protein
MATARWTMAMVAARVLGPTCAVILARHAKDFAVGREGGDREVLAVAVGHRLVLAVLLALTPFEERFGWGGEERRARRRDDGDVDDDRRHIVVHRHLDIWAAQVRLEGAQLGSHARAGGHVCRDAVGADGGQHVLAAWALRRLEAARLR